MDVGNAASPFGAGVALTFARHVFTQSEKPEFFSPLPTVSP
jgi:hypothetical protein